MTDDTLTVIDVTDDAPRHQGRRTAVALGVAGAVIAGTVAVILVAGYTPLPAMPSLAADPDPSLPGTIAFVHGTWESPCIATVPAAGAQPVDLTCDGLVPEGLAWTTDGDLAVAAWDEFARMQERLGVTILDPATGRAIDQVDVAADPVGWTGDRAERPDGARLLASTPSDSTAVLRVRWADGTSEEILRLTGPRDYGVLMPQWSPDGAWILAMDTRGRVFVVAPDGDAGPRLVAETGGRDAPVVPPAWWVDGVATQTVDLEQLQDEPTP